MLAGSNLTCNEHEDPPPQTTPALACGDLPIEAFLVDAAWNFLGVDLAAQPAGEPIDDDLLDEMGLGEIAPKVAALDAAIRAGTLDLVRWPSVTGLSSGDAERTIVAAAILLDPELELRCEYLRYLPEGPPRTVLEVALLVNESQARPVPDIAIVDQPFEEHALTFEIACAARGALGLGSCDDDDHEDGEGERHIGSDEDDDEDGARHGDHEDDDGDGDEDEAQDDPDHDPPMPIGLTTVLDSPVLQLYAAVRGAQRAKWRGSPPSQVSDPGAHRPWAYGSFGRSQARFDYLRVVLGRRPSGIGIVDGGGGGIEGTGLLGGVSIRIPPGALGGPTVGAIYGPDGAPAPFVGLVPEGPAAEFVLGTAILSPVQVRMSWWPELARSILLAPGTPSVTTFDEVQQAWIELPTQVEGANTVVAEVAHLSWYQAAAPPSVDLVVGTVAAEPGAVNDTAVSSLGTILWVTGGRDHELRGLIAGVPKTIVDGRLDPITSRLVGRLEAVVFLRPTFGVLDRLVLATVDHATGEGRVYVLDLPSNGLASSPVLLAGGGLDLAEGMIGTEARLMELTGIAAGRSDRIYFSEIGSLGASRVSRVRAIEANAPHEVSTVLGGLKSFFNGDGPVPGPQMRLDLAGDVGPSTLEMNGHLLFVADTFNNRVRVVNVDATASQTFGGLLLDPGYAATALGSGPSAVSSGACPAITGAPGMGTSARSASIVYPYSVTLTPSALVVAETCQNRLLVMPLEADPWPGLIGDLPLLPVTRLAGTGVPGETGDGGPAGLAKLIQPVGLSFDRDGNRVLFGGWGGGRVRQIEFRDRDRDDLGDSVDNCPFGPNPDQADIDSDGIGDACDDDSDGDGIRDFDDNCPLTPNSMQLDSNADGVGDLCSRDSDGDGLSDEAELLLGTDPANCDSDGDGTCDGAATCTAYADPCALKSIGEVAAGTDPRFPPPDPIGPPPPPAPWLWVVDFELPFQWEDRRVSACGGHEDFDRIAGTLRGQWGYWSPGGTGGGPLRLDDTGTVPFVRLENLQMACEHWTDLPGGGGCEQQCVPSMSDASIRVSPGIKVEALSGALGPQGQRVYFDFGPGQQNIDNLIITDASGPSPLQWEDLTGLSGALLSHGSGSLCLPDPFDPDPTKARSSLFAVPRQLFKARLPFVWQSSPVGDGAVACDGSKTNNGRTRLSAGTFRFAPVLIKTPEDVQGGTHRTPTSQFVYTSASPGALPITYALMIPPLVTPQARAFLEQNATWTTPAIGTNVDCGAASPTGGQVQVCWARGRPGADPRMQRIGANVDVTYRGLPPKNSDFGRKRVEVEVKDVDASVVLGLTLRSMDHADFEVFFPPLSDNHPGPKQAAPWGPGIKVRSPNFFFYWCDPALCGPNDLYDSGISTPSIAAVTWAGYDWVSFDGPRSAVSVGPGAFGSTPFCDTRVLSNNTSFSRSGIDRFAVIIAHEDDHVKQISRFSRLPYFENSTNPLRDAAHAGWANASGGAAVPRPGDGTPLSANCPANVEDCWNRFEDKAQAGQPPNGRLDIAPADERLDRDEDMVPNTEDPAPDINRGGFLGGGDLERSANDIPAALIKDCQYWTKDWSWAGKQWGKSTCTPCA